jgi:hypothetical protein
VNLRKDHYRVLLPFGVDLPPDVYIAFVALAGPRARQSPPQPCLTVSSEYYIIVKTFNNGSLGSGIDEERSEMR